MIRATAPTEDVLFRLTIQRSDFVEVLVWCCDLGCYIEEGSWSS
jgi:hypothetical protein